MTFLRKTAAAAAVLGFLPLVAGCPGGGGDAGPGGSTPQEVFEKAKAAIESEDIAGLYPHLTPDSQGEMLGGMILAAGFMTMGDEEKAEKVKELFEKHGIAEDSVTMETAEDPEALKKVREAVTDAPGFLAALMALMEREGEDGEDGENPTAGELRDVEIDGDTATAKVTMTRGDEEDEQELTFKRIDGRWFLEIK